MRAVRNTTNRPLAIALGRGKVLHLGPRKEGRIATGDLERPSVQELIDEGTLELVGSGGGRSRRPSDEHAHTDTHGHRPDTSVPKRGDR